jgi:outer membrane protein assembly factor BamB
LFLGLSSAEAVSTSFFRAETSDDLSTGTPENISVIKDGTIVLSPPLAQKFESLEPYIWSVAVDSRGNIYAGTGNEGRIYMIKPSGDSTLLFDSPEAEILSLVIDEKGKVYAGSAPGGIIYQVDENGGKVLFDSDEKYIWSMALDKNGDIIAGTGDKGRVYRVKKNGEAQVILESGQVNITKVVVRDGKVYAGSANDGILFEMDGKTTRVIYDTAEKEVRSILFDAQGNILVGATNGEPAPGEAPKPDESSGGSVKSGASSIYRIAENGTATQIVSWPSYTLLDMAMIKSGDMVVGTGEEGRLLKVTQDGATETINQVKALQAISIATNDQFIISTGNMGKVYTLGKEPAATGTFTSGALDAVTISSWGVISWNAEAPSGTGIGVQTRSGNTEKPDQTWSQWSESYDNSKGSKVTSPEARFLQWRAVLSTKNPSATPALRDVSIAYLQENIKPSIGDIKLEPSAADKQPAGQGQDVAGKTRPPLRGLQTVSWTAQDPNADSLKYTVQFRGTGQTNWLMMGDDLRTTSYSFDTQSLPDGKYTIRVKASDSPSNPDNIALTDERESDPFIIDNTPPEVFRMGSDEKPGRKYRITFQVEDGTSPIASCEYSVDAKPWRPVFPIDEIFDTIEESFVFETPSLSVGQHVVVVRATDAAANIGANRLIVEAK